MVDQEHVQIFLDWCLGTSAAAGAAEVVTTGYFVRAGVKVYVAENIGVNMGFVLHLKEEGRWSFVGNRPCKVVEIGNAKRFQTDLRKEAYESRVTVSKLGCNICRK